MQQETMLLHGTGVNGYYLFKAFYYQLLLLKVTLYFSISEVLCQKRKPQIDGLLKSVLHILGQEKYCLWRTRSLNATAIKGYHVSLLQVVHQKRKPHIDGLFLTILHILGR